MQVPEKCKISKLLVGWSVSSAVDTQSDLRSILPRRSQPKNNGKGGGGGEEKKRFPCQIGGSKGLRLLQSGHAFSFDTLDARRFLNWSFPKHARNKFFPPRWQIKKCMAEKKERKSLCVCPRKMRTWHSSEACPMSSFFPKTKYPVISDILASMSRWDGKKAAWLKSPSLRKYMYRLRNARQADKKRWPCMHTPGLQLRIEATEVHRPFKVYTVCTKKQCVCMHVQYAYVWVRLVLNMGKLQSGCCWRPLGGIVLFYISVAAGGWYQCPPSELQSPHFFLSHPVFDLERGFAEKNRLILLRKYCTHNKW